MLVEREVEMFDMASISGSCDGNVVLASFSGHVTAIKR